MTEQVRADLWQRQQRNREAFVTAFRATLKAAPSPLAASVHDAWEPRINAASERGDTDLLPDDGNVWTPGEDT